jgi:methylmalonyl-CoA/ethylmalonyl-CoA epimerase
MNKSAITLLIISLFLTSLKMQDKASTALIPEKEMVQVGIVVKDIEKSARHWAAFLGEEEIPDIFLAAESELNPTEYRGKPTDASARLAFFQLDNITVELIEPVGGPSTWQEFLDTRGEGVHHIAFNVKGMKTYIKSFGEHGIPMVQHGGWDTGEYSYMDGSSSLALIIELLENYE